MDISALSEKKFNAVDWINIHYKKYLEENAAGANDSGKTNQKHGVDTIDTDKKSLAFINNYVSKLQLYVQQVTYAVEDTSQQLVASMPRIVKDARTLQTDVQQLQKRMNAIRAEVASVQEETGDCMATLERLNTLQTKLQIAKESLQESDGWGNLIAELEDCFERNDLKGVCEKLVALQKSLQAQEQLPGHGDRQGQVEDFKNRLEALASPAVVHCFAEGNVEHAKRYVDLFTGIERLSQLQQYYRAVQKNALQQQWKQTLELLQSSEGATSQQQERFLTLFYDSLMEHLQTQVKWCAQVFTNTNDTTNDTNGQLQPFLVIAELLPALQPTRDAHILQLLKASNDRLELLQQYSQSNHTFVLHLNAFLEQSNIVLPEDLHLHVGESIYEYFHKFIQQYPRLEETHLSTQVDRLIVSQSNAGDSVRHLDDSMRKVFDWLMEVCQRCENITSDLALCKLIALLGNIFKRVLENFSKTQRQLGLSAGASAATDTDWSMLQCSMSLLQCLADFQLRLNRFEKYLHERMSSLVDKLQASAKLTTINIYCTYDRAELQRIRATISDYQQRRLETSSSHALCLGIFMSIYDSLKSHFTETHDIALNILLRPIEAHLMNIQPPVDADGANGGGANSSFAGVDMPSFSFVPQECITQIGQYLLTLPQHLEPLLLTPSTLLKQALEMCNIKYAQSIPCADILLSLVVEQCCIMYQSQILQIKSLHPSATKQLTVDIEYLSSVVEELGLSISTHLSQILTLLKVTPEDYSTLSSGCEPRLVTAIRQMRNIISQ